MAEGIYANKDKLDANNRLDRSFTLRRPFCPRLSFKSLFIVRFCRRAISHISGERREHRGAEALRGGGAHSGRGGGSAPPSGGPGDRRTVPHIGTPTNHRRWQRSTNSLTDSLTQSFTHSLTGYSITEVYTDASATNSEPPTPSPTVELPAADPPSINITVTDSAMETALPRPRPNGSSASQSSRSSTTQSEISSSDMSIPVREEPRVM